MMMSDNKFREQLEIIERQQAKLSRRYMELIEMDCYSEEHEQKFRKTVKALFALGARADQLRRQGAIRCATQKQAG